MHELLSLEFITTIASFITAAGVIFSASRRGKKWFFREIHSRIDELGDLAKNLQRESRRLEILMLIKDYPENKEAIENAFSYYKNLGANSYVDGEVKNWRAENSKKEGENNGN